MKYIITLAAVILLIYGIFRMIPAVLGIMGNKAFADGDMKKAIRLYKKASQMSARHAKMYAVLLMRDGSFREAETILNGIILDRKTKPADAVSAKVYRAMAQNKLGKTEEALENAEELFEDVKNTQIYSLIGYLRQENGDAALQVCEEAYDYNSDDRDICDNLVNAYIMTGDYKKAEETAAELREKYPEFVEGFYHSALIAKECGDYKKAAEYAEAALKGKRNALTTVSEEKINALKEEIKNA